MLSSDTLSSPVDHKPTRPCTVGPNFSPPSIALTIYMHIKTRIFGVTDAHIQILYSGDNKSIYRSKIGKTDGNIRGGANPVVNTNMNMNF